MSGGAKAVAALRGVLQEWRAVRAITVPRRGSGRACSSTGDRGERGWRGSRGDPGGAHPDGEVARLADLPPARW